jgi:putative transposase
MGSAGHEDGFLLSFSTFGQRPALAGSHAAIFCRVLARLHQRLDFRLYAFVILPDRARLIVATSDGTLDSVERLAQRLRSRLGRELEWRTRWPGPVFREVAGVVPLGGGVSLLRRVDFLHRLPVLMGLAAEPWEWRWSSYRGWSGMGRPPAPVDRPRLPPGGDRLPRAFSG